MNKEFKVACLIQATSKHPPVLGHARIVRVSGAADLPLPDNIDLLKVSKYSIILQSSGMGGLFAAPRHGGHDYWIVVSNRLTPDGPDTENAHTQLLERYEGPSQEKIVWLAPINTRLTWRHSKPKNTYRIHEFTVRLNRAFMDTLSTSLGDPTPVLWSLMPKRSPGAVRVTPTAIQTWISL